MEEQAPAACGNLLSSHSPVSLILIVDIEQAFDTDEDVRKKEKANHYNENRR